MVTLVYGRNLDTIIGSQTINSFLPLKCDLELGACALYATELVGQFATERQENRPLFTLLIETMQQLSLCHGTSPPADGGQAIESGVRFPSPSMGEGQDGGGSGTSALLRRFELHLLNEVGYRPQLQLCVSCRLSLPHATTYFSAASGGVVCPNCRHKHSFIYPLGSNTLSALQTLQEVDWTAARQALYDVAARREMETVLRHYLRYLLERDIRSAAWLDTLRMGRNH
jgi:DNA repair protein RecO (recombination protein O)